MPSDIFSLNGDMLVGRRSSHLLGNSGWNAAAFFVGVGLNLLILPFVIARIGVASFGVAGLVTACIAPALILSNSLAQMTVRELALRLTAADLEEARRFFATAVALGFGIALPVSVLLSLAGPPLARLAFHLGGKTPDDLELAFMFGCAGWLCQCLSAVFVALFTARQQYPRIAAVTIISGLVSTCAMVLLIPRWPAASTFLGCQALGFSAGLLAAVAIARRAMPQWVPRPAVHREALASLVNLGAWQAAAQSGGLIAAQADRYLLGAFLAPQFVGFYVIAQRLEEAVYIGVLKIGEILFPFFSTIQREDPHRIADLLFRSSWVLNVVGVSLLGALIPIAGPLLYLWAGPEVASSAQHVLVLMAVGGILGCSSNVFSFYLLANGRSRANATIALVTAAFTLATSVVALPRFGWQAAAWSSCVGMVAQIAVSMILMRKSFGFGGIWSRMAHFVLLPLGTGIVTALALRFLTGWQQVDRVSQWWYVAGSYGLAVGIIFAVVAVVSRIGPHGATCWHDLHLIAGRFLPLKAR